MQVKMYCPNRANSQFYFAMVFYISIELKFTFYYQREYVGEVFYVRYWVRYAKSRWNYKQIKIGFFFFLTNFV